MLSGQPVWVTLSEEEAVGAVVAGVDDDGALLAQTANGLRRFHSGDVSLRPAEDTLPALPDALGLSMPILAIDAGNTRIKWGLWEDRGFVAQGSILTARAGELADALHMLARPQRAIGCSVAGAQVRAQIEQALAPWGVRSGVGREPPRAVRRGQPLRGTRAARRRPLGGADRRARAARRRLRGGQRRHRRHHRRAHRRGRVPRRPDPAGAGVDGRSARHAAPRACRGSRGGSRPFPPARRMPSSAAPCRRCAGRSSASSAAWSPPATASRRSC